MEHPVLLTSNSACSFNISLFLSSKNSRLLLRVFIPTAEFIRKARWGTQVVCTIGPNDHHFRHPEELSSIVYFEILLTHGPPYNVV
jgi:hypothetical protein